MSKATRAVSNKLKVARKWSEIAPSPASIGTSRKTTSIVAIASWVGRMPQTRKA